MKPVKIEWYKSSPYLSEISQSSGFRFAFASKPIDGKIKQIHPWVKCRDFLNDVIFTKFTGNKGTIYGFRWDPEKDPPLDTARTRLLVKRIPFRGNKSPDKEHADFDKMIQSALTIVNHYERQGKISPLSKIVEVDDDKEHSYMFLGSGVWSKSPVMISIYTLLIRLGFYKPKLTSEKDLEAQLAKVVESSSSNDAKYLRTVLGKIHPAIEHRELHSFKLKGENPFKGAHLSAFHDHSGIVALAKGHTPDKKLNDTFKKIFGEAKK